MSLTRRSALIGGAVLATPAPIRAQERPAMLRHVARRAAIYLYPLYEMYRTRWQATANPQNPFRSPLNRFRHVPNLATDRTRAVTTPNNDTLYSSAWLALGSHPVFLTVPPMGELYYSYAFMDLFTNNFAYVSRRLNGGAPTIHMIAGPEWTGDPPADVTLIRAPTNSVWLLGRILVDGPDDLPAVRAMQARTLLESRDQRNERRMLESKELMSQRTSAPAEPVADWPAPDPALPYELLDVSMRALGESPLAARDRAEVESLAPLRLRPGRPFDAAAFGDVELQAIRAGLAEAEAEIRTAGSRYGRTVNGWTYGERHLGNFGDDYLYRAVVALAGLAALAPAEAVYVVCNSDSDGRPLTGINRYVLAFPAGALPPAKAFWSLAMYELTFEGRAFFTPNELDRYAIGDRTRGLHWGSDGSLELYLQRNPPEGAKAANWLPAPAGPMRLVLRAYEPGEAMIEGTYRVPGVRRIS
jgi:hypothetical protein